MKGYDGRIKEEAGGPGYQERMCYSKGDWRASRWGVSSSSEQQQQVHSHRRKTSSLGWGSEVKSKGVFRVGP